MSKSTNMVIYFDWKTVIYIYVCGKYRTQFMLPIEKSVTFTGACANEIIPSINHLFVYKAKEGGHVRIIYKIQSTVWYKVIDINHKCTRKDKSEALRSLYCLPNYHLFNKKKIHNKVYAVNKGTFMKIS